MVDIKQNDASKLTGEERQAAASWPGLTEYNPGFDADPGRAGRRLNPQDSSNLRQQLAQQEMGAAPGGEGHNEKSANTPEQPKQKPGMRTRLLSAGKRLLNKATGRKKLMFAGGAGVIGAIVLVAIVAGIIASLLKIPNLAGDITAYEFGAISRQMRQNTDLVTEESLAVQSASDEIPAGETTGMWQNLKTKYFDEPVARKLKPVSDLWTKMNDNYNPNQIIDNISADKGLKIHVKVSGLGRRVVQGVTLDGVEYPVEQVSGKVLGVPKKWIPILRDVEVARNNGAFLKDFAPKLVESFGLEDTASIAGQLARGAALSNWLRRGGFTLSAWVISAFDDKNAPSPRVVETEQKYQKVEESNPNPVENNAGSEPIRDGVDEIHRIEEDIAHDPKRIANEVIPHDGVPEAIRTSVITHVGEDWATNVLSVTDPILGIALPICIIYDGSVIQSQPTIDQSTYQQMQLATFILSAAAQQNHGSNDPGLLKAIEATNEDLGDTTNTIPVQRAMGHSVNTNSTISAEAGAGGANYYDIYSLLNVDHNTPIGKAINFYTSVQSNNTKTICDSLTNTGVVLTISAANIIAALVTLGSSEAAEETGAQLAALSVKQIATSVGERILGPKIAEEAGGQLVERTVVNRAGRFIVTKLIPFGLKQIGILGAIGGATLLARLIVATRAGQLNSGFTQGSDLADSADAGANLIANSWQQTAFFGRSLTNKEVAQRDAADQQQIAYENSSKSFTERYFALTNRNSLVVRSAEMFSSIFKPTLPSSFLGLSNSLFQPLNTIGSLFGSLSIAQAAPDPSTQHYGNVQFGWSEDENKLVRSDYSYLPLQNQLILDESGKEQLIAKTYAKCFAYDYNDNGDGNLDPSDPNSNLQLNIMGEGSIGHLLANKDIARDMQGNVLDDPTSLCSPQFLGPKNSIFGDLVFRWRLAMSYDMTLTHLTDLQTITK